MAKIDFEKDFQKLLKIIFQGLMMENVKNEVKRDIIKDDNGKTTKQQSKITFNGIPKNYTSYDIYTYKQNKALLHEPNYLGFGLLQFSMLHM